MFPIRFDFPFRKANGDMSTIGAEISAGGGGGGSSYTLPTASTETKGGIKIGAGLSMEGEVLNNTNPTAYTLPTASADTKGGVKVGTGLSIDENGVLSNSGGGGGGASISRFRSPLWYFNNTAIFKILAQDIAFSNLPSDAKIISAVFVPEDNASAIKYCNYPAIITVCKQTNNWFAQEVVPNYDSSFSAYFGYVDIFYTR